MKLVELKIYLSFLNLITRAKLITIDISLNTIKYYNNV